MLKAVASPIEALETLNELLIIPGYETQDAYVVATVPADYELDLTQVLTLPTGVTATAASLSARGAYVSSANEVVSIALSTVLPSLTASAFTVEVECEIDPSYIVANATQTVFEVAGNIANNRHVAQLRQVTGSYHFGYANVSTAPSLSVKTGSNQATGLARVVRVLSACSGNAATFWAGSEPASSPTDLQALAGTLSLNLGATKSLNQDYFFGWIRRVRIWQSVVSTARQRAGTPTYIDDVAAWGDSLTQGAGASPANQNYPVLLSKRLRRNVYNKGVSGQTSTQIRDRFIAETNRIKDGVTAIWSGRNNPVAATVLADVQAMTTRLPAHGKFLVLNVINKSDGTENAGSPAYNNIIATNNALAAAYPANYVPVREMLVARSGGANDAPSPSITVDGLHLTSTGYDWVAEMVEGEIKGRGW